MLVTVKATHELKEGDVLVQSYQRRIHRYILQEDPVQIHRYALQHSDLQPVTNEESEDEFELRLIRYDGTQREHVAWRRNDEHVVLLTGGAITTQR